jgi:hypothetical protein
MPVIFPVLGRSARLEQRAPQIRNIRMISVIRAWLARQLRDPLRQQLGEQLLIEVPPAAVADYALPPYVRHKRVRHPLLKRLWRKNPLYRWIAARAPLLLSGDWDREAQPFRQMPTYVFLADLQACAFEYRRTAYFQQLLNDLHAGRGRSYKGLKLDSEQALDRLFEGYVRVFRSMAAEGYRADLAADAICVMVGRDGRLIKEEKGRHRLAIAQLVGVPRVPVLVRHIHPDWLVALGEGGVAPSATGIRRALQALPLE